MKKIMRGGALEGGKSFYNKKGIILAVAAIVLVSGFFVVNFALAAHTATVTVNPTLVKSGTSGTYSFNISNDSGSANPIYRITITAPAGFTISDALVCPTGWASTSASTYVDCLGDGDPSTGLNIPAGDQTTISFLATAPGTDSTNPWVVLTKDNVYSPQTNNPVTIVDATAPVISLVGENPVTVEAGSIYTDAGATALDNIDGDVTSNIIIVNPVNNNSAVGTYIVIYNVSDAMGNPATQITRTVNVVDTTPPTITPPADQTFEATGPETTLTTLVPATAVDIVDPNPVITYDPHSFAVGTHTVTWTATDASINISTTTSQVIIIDTTPPVIALHADVTAQATSASGATVTYDLPTATDLVDGSVIVTCAPASGSQFILGDTTVNCSAQDSQIVPNIATSHFTVHVVDTTKPSVTAPVDITQEANGVLSTVDLGTPIVSDVVDTNPTVINNAPTGFPIGITVVTWTATDFSGNSQTATQNVTIIDTTDPVITAPIVQTFEATGPETTPTTLVPATATDIADPAPVVTYTPHDFAVGTHTVTWTATDVSTNSSTITSQVTITDLTAPIISVHDTVTAEATSASGATVTYDLPTATDLVDGAVVVTCTPISGSTFALGSATVSCSATDIHSNIGHSSFTVHVVDTTSPAILEGTLLTPSASGIFIKGGSNYTITWNSGNITDLYLGETPIKIEYAGNGVDYVLVVANGLSNSGSYIWTTPTSDSATGKIKITATDLNSNSSSIVSTNPFTIDSTNPAVSIASPVDDQVIKGSSVTLSSSATDSSAVTCQYKIDGGVLISIDCAGGTINEFTDGRHMLTLIATDAATNSSTAEVSFVVDTDNTLTVGSGEDFTTIQAAVDKATADDTISVAAGTYSENVTINKNLKIVGTGSPTATSFTLSNSAILLIGSGGITAPIITVSANSKIQDGILLASSGGTVNVAAGAYNENVSIAKSVTLQGVSGTNLQGQITISHDDVTIDGFDITNPAIGYGIVATDHSDLSIKNNTIHDIGTTLASGSAQAIYVKSSSATVTNVTISGNHISNVGNTSLVYSGSGSAKGIFIGDSTGMMSFGVVNISDNEITNVFASVAPWTAGRGAYGILVNHKSTGLQITGNTISTLEGLWAHAVGLEGNTPNAVVTGNTISNLVDHKAEHDAIGIFVEDNVSVETIFVNENSIDTDTVYYGVASNPITAPGTVDATNNWWGVAVPDFTMVTAGSVNHDPWYLDEAMNILSSSIGTVTIYVNSSYIADGTNDGHYWGLNAFNTIQGGINAVDEGGTVDIVAGTYNESILIENEMSLVGSGVTKPVITGLAPANYIAKIDSANDVVIDNFEINGGATNSFSYGIFVNNSGTEDNPVEVKNSTIKNIWQSSGIGIGVENSSYILADNNTVSSFHKSGIRFVSSSGKFYDSEVIGDNVDGTNRVQNLVNLWSGSNVEVYGNKLHNALTTPGVTPTWDSVGVFVSAYYGSYSDSGSSSANIHDNEIYDSDSGVVVGSTYADADESSATVTNNNLHNLNWAINFEKSTVSATITKNNFADNNNKAINDDVNGDHVTPAGVTAEMNWWGSTSGPATDTVFAGLDYRPWCTELTCAVENEDYDAPTLDSFAPANNAVGVDPTAAITLAFSEAVNVLTSDVSLTTGGSPVDITISGSGTANVSINPPAGGLLNNSTYAVTIKISTADLAGNTLAEEKTWSFTTAGSYSFTLTNGWNLVSLGVVPNNTAIATILGSTSTNVESVWAYDAVNDAWSVYHPSSIDTGNLLSMTAGTGYWISYNGASSATLSGSGNLFLAGNNTPPSRTLKAGWNLIGYYQRESSASASVTNALKTLENTDTNNPWWSMIIKYDNSAKQFGQVYNSDSISAGQGYWILLGGKASDTYIYAPGQTD